PETGVTIMKMDQGVDTGAIINQCAIKSENDDTAGSLSEKLSHLGADLLIETLPRYLSGELKPHAQDESKATYASMLKKENGLLDFTQPVEELARRVRAFSPWPGAYFEWNGGMLKIHQAHAEMENASEGQRLIYQGQPAVGARGGILILDEVQPAGKKSMNGKAFLSGARNWSD
ncbi:MAG: methionyl-tRNA formyltransferase, partial [Anaerolineales bacterium]